MESNSRTLSFLSFFIALTIYLSCILSFYYYFYDKIKSKKYSAKNEVKFEVSIVNEKTDTPSKVRKDVFKLEEVKKNTSVSKKEGESVNKLFSTVESKEVVEDTTSKEKRSKTPTINISTKDRIKTPKQVVGLDELSSIVGDIKIRRTPKAIQTEGEYDEYYAKVQNIIYGWWKPLYTETKRSSDVLFMIKEDGSFKYKIIRKSGDLQFDSSLQEFLLKIKFNKLPPPHKNGKTTDVNITFRTAG